MDNTNEETIEHIIIDDVPEETSYLMVTPLRKWAGILTGKRFRFAKRVKSMTTPATRICFPLYGSRETIDKELKRMRVVGKSGAEFRIARIDYPSPTPLCTDTRSCSTEFGKVLFERVSTVGNL